jgi:hypothetical protein
MVLEMKKIKKLGMALLCASRRYRNEKKNPGEPGKKEEREKDNQLVWVSM